ncbi:MAG: transglycosylase SLT domain-containing protein [Anaerolineaceae bacterium]|nr:transglycosylase SLT domain-containing protein [Anaerolineaceae bacterium]
MNPKPKIATIILVLVGLLGCNLPFAAQPAILPQVSDTPPPPTPTFLPTQTPTPNPSERVVQADLAIFHGDYQRAILENETALNIADDDQTRAAARYGIARAQYLSNNYQGAMDTLLAFITAHPGSDLLGYAYFLLGKCYDAEEEHLSAAEAYAKFIELRPGVIDATANMLRGDALAAAGDVMAAIQAYEAAIQSQQLGDTQQLEIKIGRVFFAASDYANAVRKYMAVYETTTDGYTKAQVNLLAAQAYTAMGLPEQAYARYQDSVNNYPMAYDSYSALVALVNAGQPVNDLNRGLVNYFARQYGYALDALERYTRDNPEHDGTAIHYKALTLRALGNYERAFREWDTLIDRYSGDRFWASAFEEKAATYDRNLMQLNLAAQTMLDFVRRAPTAPEAPDYLFRAGRYLERDNRLEAAADVWERMMNEYPGAELSYRGLFLAGVTRYRLGRFDHAQTTFQRALLLATVPNDQAAASLWIGKTHQAQNDPEGARQAWQDAQGRDPSGYYSERARELLAGEAPLSSAAGYDLNIDLAAERRLAELWLRNTFAIPSEVDLNNLGDLANDGRVVRGTVFWELGLYPLAANEFESLRLNIQQDPAANFRMLNYLLELGFYRPAIFMSRQILNLAQMDDAETFTAPKFFNHVRFGVYFKEIVLSNAATEKIHPLLVFSLIRQESMFDTTAVSVAGASGLMQIMPATGDEIVTQLGWPPAYRTTDLRRPMVNVRLGARYLARQRDYFGGDMYAALAAYNGGWGNAIDWKNAAGDDPDLFLEVVRFTETRRYLMNISEFMNIYRRLYEVSQ